MANLIHEEKNHSYSFQCDVFEGFDADCNTEFSCYAFDRVSPSADQLYVPYPDIDTKYRSISVAHPSQTLFRAHGSATDASKRGLVDRNDLFKSHAKKHTSQTFEVIPSTRQEASLLSDISSHYKAPPQPFLLMPSHIEINAPLDDIMYTIKNVLTEFPEISFECIGDECMVRPSQLSPHYYFLHILKPAFSIFPFHISFPCQWNAVYLRGSTHCKIQISVYTNGAGFIVEGNRLSVSRVKI